MKNNLSQFTNRYSVSKTLRFELIPVGVTKEQINAKGLISQDKQRADSYQEMKKTIDAFHKHFIELAMRNVELTQLQAFNDLYFSSAERKKEESYKAELKKIQENLRKEIANGFKSGEAKDIFSKIDKKELITQLLEDWMKLQNEKFYFDEGFKNFTTYFGGFHENRKNMYSDKEQSTAIAYRLIHENLPKFLDNIKVFEKIKLIPELYDKCKELYGNIEEYLNIKYIDEAFEIEYFNEVLTQRQIDVYNLIIGGRVGAEGDKKTRGLNEYINLYNQKQKDKSKRIPKLKVLYKQILSDREKTSFVMDKFEKSEDVTEAINSFYHHNILSYQPNDSPDAENLLNKLESLLAIVGTYETDKIFLRNDAQLTTISQKIFGSYSVIPDAISYYYDQVINPKFEEDYAKAIDKKKEKLDAEKNKFLKQDYFTIRMLQVATDNYFSTLDDTLEIKKKYTPYCIADYFKNHFKAEKIQDSDKEFTLTANIEAKYSCIKGLLENYPEDRMLHQDKKTIDNIKLFLDAMMELLHFVKPLMLPSDSILEKDTAFYNQLEPWYDALKEIIPLYNKVRNYATQKPYSTEKFKLNFENSTLLDGWDVNKEEANSGILFIKNGLYFLGIMDKRHNKILRDIPKKTTDRTYSKVNYKLLPGASKMLPKVFFSAKNIGFYNPSVEILHIRNHGSHTKNGDSQKGFQKLDFNLKDCHKMIDFFKDSIQKHPEWKNFGFNFSDTSTYDSIDGFYREVEAQGYTIGYTEIDEDYIHQFVDEGKLFLFQIYNKDFSPYSMGKPNMHTLYWKALFSPENLKDVIYKLNGKAEVFYRKASIKQENRIVHKANEPVGNKNPLAKKKESTFAYDLVKDQRFTEDKFQFHVPITMNFKAKDSDYLNEQVLEYLKNNPDTKIIGLDRGERHLIYLTLINQQGEILHQESLNTLKNEHFDIDTPYHTLLSNKEKERDNARKSWGTIENIKELKEGYLSQVVHKIAKMMVEENAIVVMEDLNMGFKRGRFKIEKQVYQKLEKMLIDKLNYLVLKEKNEDETGGLYRALQLANRFKSFKEMGKQSGFLFYVPAWNTSKIDPTTGFVNLFNTKYENIEKAKVFFKSFKSIRFNETQGYFEFSFDYNDFTAKAEGTKTEWVVCTFGDRIKTFRNSEKNNNWDNVSVNITAEFQNLLGKYEIQYQDGRDIKEQIIAQEDRAFFKALLDSYKLTLQMRNSITNSDEDYLISPVMNNQGTFYDSRNASGALPENADANGAYHIAQKGLMWVKQIQQHDSADWKNLFKNLEKTNKGWLKFAQSEK